MGLDMYLTRKISQNALFNAEKELFYVRPVKDKKLNPNATPEFVDALEKAFTPYSPSYSSELAVMAGYWRKANAIHQWFIDNAGVDDDCRAFDVDLDALHNLREIIVKILKPYDASDIKKAQTLAEELLPTSSGFFFGDTEYNDDYFDMLRDTLEILNNEIALAHTFSKNDFSFDISWTYQASW